jgi:hypothetical protein
MGYEHVWTTLRAAGRLLGGALALLVAGTLASTLAFPFGGGEFHAMFAYSDGSIPAAHRAFVVHVGTVCAVAALLVALGWRLPWGVIALLATALAGLYWWSVYTWQPQSPEFHRMAGMLLITIPVIAFASCGLAYIVRRRVLSRIARTSAGTGIT